MSLNLVRWGGLAALGAGVLFLIGDLIIVVAGVDFHSAESQSTASYASVFILWLLAGGLLLLGLVGLYVRQSEATGVLGLVGFLAAFSGTVLVVGFFWNSLFITPLVAAEVPELHETIGGSAGEPLGTILSVLAYSAGWVLFGVATLRAGIYPRAAAIALIVGAVLALVPIQGISGIVFDAAVAWLGFALLTGRTGRVASGEEPTRSSELIRKGAPIAALLAGIAWVANGLEVFGSTPYPIQTIQGIALIGTLGGLVGLHVRQAASPRYGRLGAVGFFSAFIGATLWLNALGKADLYPPLSQLGFLGMVVGFVLLGITTLRARVLPRWCGLLLILNIPLWVVVTAAIALVADVDGGVHTSLTLALIWLALGYALLRQHEEEPPEGMPSQRSSGASEVPGTQ